MPAEWKLEEVERLKELIHSYPVVGIVGIGRIPASQMHEMRKMLRDIAVLRVSKNTLIEHALQNGNGVSKLKDYIEAETAIIATEMNPFKLFRKLEKMKMSIPAKGGEIAPDDIVIKKGETPFKPGPIVGDLQKVGIPAAIREGKVMIEKTVTLVKKGEVIKPEVAQMLTRLEIYPLQIGLNVRALYEDGSIFTPDVLSIDTEKIMNDFYTAKSNAFNLALEIGYTTKETIEYLLQKAYRNSFTLAIESNIYTPETIEEIIKKAHLASKALAKELKTET
ncbi:50S ribosomal protein L10 [Thermoplasmatales archaeon ex4484_30]|nr:MAG: 50S ribosomal protein L10 [Thermoplasmatales archaeon ex4484_30]